MADNSSERALLVRRREEGLSIFTASMFLAGGMAGTGILALPYAVVGTGVTGFLWTIFFAINGSYIGYILGLSWTMLSNLENDNTCGSSSSYHSLNEEAVRDAFPLLAEKAGNLRGQTHGRLLRVLCILCLCVTMYGTAVVIIELIGGMLYNLSSQDFPYCAWLVIAAATITPLTWFGSPKDFWQLAFFALLTTMTVCILCVIEIPISNSCEAAPPGTSSGIGTLSPSALTYLSGFATIMYAFGGAPIFPNILVDMKERTHFKYSALAAHLILFVIYFPTAAVGYVYLAGDCVKPNMLNNLADGSVKLAASVIIILHLYTAAPIAINPPNQWLEEMINIPKNFTWRRVVFRTISMAALLFIAMTIPTFDSVLALVGGSAIITLTYILPPIIYLICTNNANPDRPLSRMERYYNIFLIIFGIVGGFSATVVSVYGIVESKFSAPCYVTWWP